MVLDNVPGFNSAVYEAEQTIICLFKIKEIKDVIVTFYGTEGSEQLLDLDTDYSVVGTSSGFDVTLLAAFIPPEPAGVILVERYDSIDQPLAIPAGKDLPRKPLEWLFDKLTWLLQVLQRATVTFLTISEEGITYLEPIEDRAGKVQGFDDEGEAVLVDPPIEVPVSDFSSELLTKVETRGSFLSKIEMLSNVSVSDSLSTVMYNLMMQNLTEIPITESGVIFGYLNGENDNEFVFMASEYSATIPLCHVTTVNKETYAISTSSFSAAYSSRYTDAHKLGTSYSMSLIHPAYIYELSTIGPSVKRTNDSIEYQSLQGNIAISEWSTGTIAVMMTLDLPFISINGISKLYRKENFLFSDYDNWEAEDVSDPFESDFVLVTYATEEGSGLPRFLAGGKAFLWSSEDGLTWEKYGKFKDDSYRTNSIGYSSVTGKLYAKRFAIDQATGNYMFSVEQSIDGIFWTEFSTPVITATEYSPNSVYELAYMEMPMSIHEELEIITAGLSPSLFTAYSLLFLPKVGIYHRGYALPWPMFYDRVSRRMFGGMGTLSEYGDGRTI